jgi:UDP-2-acetamido-3-amino-2,3-dideoxy-glucuronate N-acetyltransferase
MTKIISRKFTKGSIVTKDVPAYALVYGNSARVHGSVDQDGEKE